MIQARWRPSPWADRILMGPHLLPNPNHRTAKTSTGDLTPVVGREPLPLPPL